MIKEFPIKKGSTLPALLLKVGDENGNGFRSDPTGAIVTFTMAARDNHGSKKIDDAAASIQNISLKADGTYYAELVYAWIAVDIDTGQNYDGEFKVVIGADTILIPMGDPKSDGTIENKYIPIEVYAGLA